MVEPVSGLREALGGELTQGLGLGQAGPQESIGVLVEAAAAGTPDAREEDLGSQRLGELPVVGAGAAIVEGERQHEQCHGLQQVLCGTPDQGRSLVRNCLCKEILRLAIDERDSGPLVALAAARVAFPVAHPLLALDNRLAATLATLVQQVVVAAVRAAVAVDLAVDPGRADGDFLAEFETAGDLLGTPVLQEQVAATLPEWRVELVGAVAAEAL